MYLDFVVAGGAERGKARGGGQHVLGTNNSCIYAHLLSTFPEHRVCETEYVQLHDVCRRGEK